MLPPANRALIGSTARLACLLRMSYQITGFTRCVFKRTVCLR